MGSGQSVRATHFSRPPQSRMPDEPEERHISISNKMIERLVEDSALASGAAPAKPVTPKPKEDYKDKIYTDKIRSLDESHSEKNKITVDDLNSLIRRIDMRTTAMVPVDAVCPDYQQRIIDCYNEAEEAGDAVRCWNTIGEFTRCVQQASAERLQRRTRADAAELARRERRVAHAREHALKDLSTPLA